MLRKIIGISLAAALLLAPTIGFGYSITSAIAALEFEGREIAVVTGCKSSRVKGSNSSSYIRSPVVVLESGQKVTGTRDEIRFFASCDTLIGQSVEVLYDPADPTGAKINVFTEMWLMPVVLGSVCALFYSIAGLSLWKRFRS